MEKKYFIVVNKKKSYFIRKKYHNHNTNRITKINITEYYRINKVYLTNTLKVFTIINIFLSQFSIFLVC
jgi:hypothetical protein